LNRRKTIDLWAKFLFILNIIAWILIIFILLFFHLAQPEFETFFDRFYRLTLQTNWNIQYLYYLIYIVIFSILISLSGLILSVYRGRRKDDHKKVLIFMGIISMVVLWISMVVL
jgi:hypothetical protein